MKIKSLYIRSYGKFDEKKIEFSDSLNIVYGNNEAGKSTIMSFIKAMLYGFEGKGNDLLVNDRKKYVPWNGKPVRGEADIVTDSGESIRLVREMGKTRKQDILHAINLNNGEEYNYSPSGVVGMGEEAFMKFFYIRAAASKLSGGNEEIEQKLINLAHSGSQDLNYRAASERLLSEIKKLKALKGPGGIIGELEKKISDLNDELKQAEEYRKKIFNLSQRLRELEARANEYSAVLDKINGEREQSEIYDKYILLEQCNSEKIDFENRLKTASDELQRYKEKIESLSMYENVPDEVIFQTIPDVKPQTKAAKIKTILTGVGIAVFGILSAYNVFALIPAAICAAFFGFFLKSNVLYRREYEKALLMRDKAEGELKKFGAKDAKDYYSKKSDYEQAKNSLKSVEEIVSKLSGSISEIQKRADEIRVGIGDNPKPENVRSTVQLAQDEKNANLALKDVLVEKSRIEGLLSADSSDRRTPDVILTERAFVIEEHDKAVSRHTALTAAYNALNTAYLRISSDFTPVVNKKASEILREITGKYDDIIANKDFSVIVNSDGVRQLASFSSGTVDQVYMALRLAVTDIIFGSSKPLFIDDAFLLYDEEREAKVLRYLEKRASGGQQIILFSCRRPKTDSQANIISLT